MGLSQLVFTDNSQADVPFIAVIEAFVSSVIRLSACLISPEMSCHVNKIQREIDEEWTAMMCCLF